MRLQIIILLLFTTIHSITSTNLKCGFSPGSSPRIVGGSEVQPHLYPWMAFIQVQYVPQVMTQDSTIIFVACDATLVDDQWLVTAAHCFGPQPGHRLNQTMVVLGAHNIGNNGEKRLVTPPSKVVYHEKYEFGLNQSRYDIALVKLQHHLELSMTNVSSQIMPICLPRPGEQISKLQCQALGWGKTGPDDNNQASILRMVPQTMQDFTECRHSRREVNELQICAGTSGASTCQGDSGGPLQCKNLESAWVLQGIVSYGDKNCGGPTPAVFTRVDQFTTWIDKVRTGSMADAKEVV